MKPSLLAFVASLSIAACAHAVEPGFSLTVYSAADPGTFDPQEYAQQVTLNPYYRIQQPLPGYGVVREIRGIDLKAGANTLRFTDVSSGIDATTVSFLSLTDPAGTSVLEQNYEYDLVSSQKLLKKYVDKEIVVERSLGDGKIESITGTLLNAEGGLVIKEREGGVRILNGYNSIRLADAASLITQPTLVWTLEAKKAGKHDAQVSYQTNGITWRADYNLVVSENDTSADIGAWVTLLNQSGKTYPNTTLKLVAGDVQRITPADQNQSRYRAMDAAKEMRSDRDQGFAEKSFFEYHLYTLGRATTIPDNSTKQIELFPTVTNVPVTKTFVYYGLPNEYRSWMQPNPTTDRDRGIPMNKKVDVYLLLENKEANGMGIPLPAGRVRVYKRDDADKNLEFVGEDVIQHTPKDEKLQIRLGSAFDIVGERKQTDFAVNIDKREVDETFEIKIRNHKKEKVTVVIKENLYRWSNWEISKTSDKFSKEDSRTIHIPVEIEPDGEKTVTYTVHYSW